jgi:ATP-binding cassette, subfamily C, bacterial CydCD
VARLDIRGPYGRARLLADRDNARRAAVLCALALLERLLTLGTAWSLLGSSMALRLAASAALALVFTGRSFVQLALGSRTQANLLDRVVVSLLHGDVLKSAVLQGEDAHAELPQALYFASQHLTRELPTLVADCLASVVIAVVIACHEPLQVVLVATVLLLLGTAALSWSRIRLRDAIDRVWDLERRAFDALIDALEGRVEIVASGSRDGFIEMARRRASAWGDAGARHAGATVLSGRLPLLGITALVLGVVAFGVRDTGAPRIGLADVALFASAIPAFSGVAQGVHAVVSADRWMRIVASILSIRAEPAAISGACLPRRPDEIVFRGVWFRYADSGPTVALRDVNLDWTGKGVLALTGPNGSGKSTVLRLLLGLGVPTSGHIRIDGTNLAQVDMDGWRSNIVFLPQKSYLPARSTIRECIRLLAPAADDAGMLAALERVDMLAPLLERSGTPLDANVDTLSVGQRQRISIARILCLGDRSLFLLDEPDANLDRAGIEMICGVIREIARTRTVLLAAHSPEMMAIADRVISLEAGTVIRDDQRPSSLRK